jgi:hypothetical protein
MIEHAVTADVVNRIEVLPVSYLDKSQVLFHARQVPSTLGLEDAITVRRH